MPQKDKPTEPSANGEQAKPPKVVQASTHSISNVGTGYRGIPVGMPDTMPGFGPADGGRTPPGGGPDVTVYLRILREQWLLIAVVFLIVTAAVAVGTFIKTPVYSATATVEIRKEAPPLVPVESFSQVDRVSEQYLQTQYSLLRRPGLLRRVVSEPGLDDRLAALTGMQAAEGGPGDQEARSVLLAGYLRKRTKVTPINGSRIARVSVELEDPQLAADLANAIVTGYLDLRGEARNEAVDRLAAQADTVRARIAQAEKNLNDFVLSNGLADVIGDGEGETVPQERLRALQDELTQAEAAVFQAAALADTAGMGAAAMADSELLKALRRRSAELESDYARLRATFTDSFPRTKQVKRELEQLDTLIAREERRVVVSVQEEHRATLRRRAMLQAAVRDQRRQLDSIATGLAEYNRLRRDFERQDALFGTLDEKREEAAIAAALAVMDAGVLDLATRPLKPVSPHPRRDIPVGALAGLILGIGLAFVRHLTDRSIRSVDDVQGVTGAPVLAMIPAEAFSGQPGIGLVGNGNRDHWHRIDQLGPDYSPLKEAFSALRTSMLYDLSGEERRTLLVTSSQPNEGKTTVSVNLAISLARLGRRVLLVDADIRRPSVHRAFSMESGYGLSEYLAGHEDWTELVRPGSVPGLDVLQAGHDGRSPADNLSSERTRMLLEEAQKKYDFVLLDAPALFLAAPDARILSHLVDGVVLVVRKGVATREVVHQLVAQVENLVGVVLNDMDMRSLPAYYREYYRDYTADSGRRAKHVDAEAEGEEPESVETLA